MERCVEAWLVSLERELPMNPAVAYDGKHPVIGCNHLVCTTCGADVRHVDSRSVTSRLPPGRQQLGELYDSPDPAVSPLLNSSPVHAKSRTYFCRCDWYAVNLADARWINDIDQTWQCAGHPPAVVVATERKASIVPQLQAVSSSSSSESRPSAMHSDEGLVKQCVEVWLVGPEHNLPTDSGVAYKGKFPLVGCSNLVCSNCAAEVRHLDDWSGKSKRSPGTGPMGKLYSAPESSPHLERQSGYRTYFCRCDWYWIDSNRAYYCSDKTWECAGHATIVADTGDVVDEFADLMATPLYTKIKIMKDCYGRTGFEWVSVATASELRDALLNSYPDADHFRRAVVEIGYMGPYETVPAWGWIIDLIRTRSDWWPVIGIALQHAVKDGGEFAPTALVDLVGNFRESIALLPWTEPLAAQWPKVHAEFKETGWGAPDFRLETIIRDQKELLAKTRENYSVFLHGYGKRGEPIASPFTSEADLRVLLETTARVGWFPDGNNGPWSWLEWELLIGAAWLRPAFVHIVSTIANSPQSPMLWALLDWLFERRDLWQFVDLLEAWECDRPPWWSVDATTKPARWRNRIISRFGGANSLGDVVFSALWNARSQVATPPIIDLPVLFGPSVQDHACSSSANSSTK